MKVDASIKGARIDVAISKTNRRAVQVEVDWDVSLPGKVTSENITTAVLADDHIKELVELIMARIEQIGKDEA